MEITFEKKKKIVANYEGHCVVTDLSVDSGGEDTALNPFQLFLTALGSCGALYMRLFYEKHNLSIEGAKLEQNFDFDEKGDLEKVHILLHVGKNFPMDKKDALIASMKTCKVRKHTNTNIEFDYTIEI